ncbi:hypothetical protein evm_014021 [Chilo suppressalis]|nr:hypothetical protein evm_014021 [Chilo suppressalis]
MRYCTNSSRNTAKSKGITFHRFPQQSQETREQWIKFVQNNRSEETWLPSNHSYICSLHFREQDKYATKSGRHYLKKSAVPCDDRDISMCAETIKPISESVSESESIFDTPRKIVLKRKVHELTAVKKKLTDKIKKVQRQNRNLKKKCESLSLLVKSLKTKFSFDGIAENNLLAKAELVEIHKRIMKKNKQSRCTLKYTPALRKFALTLHYYSPAAYKYVRSVYNNVLPHTRTLCRWYGTIDAEPGFTNEAFEVLKKKSALSDKPLVCNLVFDEMAIRRQKLYHNQQKLGAVNFGAGPQEGDCDDHVATQALVFMLVALTENWKLPVGYFLIKGITAETKANLIRTCLQKCHDVGVSVLCVTFDGCTANLKAAEILGCNLTDPNNFLTNFPHPSTQEQVCIFLDPCHVIKLIRNTFGKKRLFFDEDGKKIRWQLLINLNKLQMNEGLTFANKLTPRHLHFRNQIMKVKLATQLLSMSVAKALLLCDQVLKSSQFLDSSATVNFLTIMNNFFDIMNSRKCHRYGFKRPIDENNKSEVFDYLDKVKKYILNLELHTKFRRVMKRKNLAPRIILSISKQKIVESTNKTGFIGAIICIDSLKTIFQHAVEEKNVFSYISTYRLSQDHLELFFGIIRKHGGYNNNPNVLQFRAAYKKTLNHLELRSTFSGNCIPLDNINILNNCSIDIINGTTSTDRHEDEQYEILSATRSLESDIEAENNCEIFAGTLSGQRIPFGSQLIVGYISGYIVRILASSLKCEICVDSLTTTERLPHHKLITIKDMGGLSYSTEDVFEICLTTETVIRKLIKQSGGISLSTKYNFSYITVNTLKHFIQKNVFSSLVQHSFNQPCTLNHRIHLIRAIIHKYTTIRLKHEAKTDLNMNHLSKRQKLTKLILFKASAVSEEHSQLQDVLDKKLSQLETSLLKKMESIFRSELETLQNAVKLIPDLKQTIEFLSNRYDDVNTELEKLKTSTIDLRRDNLKLTGIVNELTDKVNTIEQQARECNLEIQCLPEFSKENLPNTVIQLAKVLNCPLEQENILSCTRVAKLNPKSKRPKTVIVKLSSPRVRDSMIAACLAYIKAHPDDKLNSGLLGLAGDKEQIYLSEHLSPNNRSLHAQARLFRKEAKYKYLWVRNGRILMRKDDESPILWIRNDRATTFSMKKDGGEVLIAVSNDLTSPRLPYLESSPEDLWVSISDSKRVLGKFLVDYLH